jgi:hypothetical protein
MFYVNISADYNLFEVECDGEKDYLAPAWVAERAGRAEVLPTRIVKGKNPFLSQTSGQVDKLKKIRTR